jgi:hypothetical protein
MFEFVAARRLLRSSGWMLPAEFSNAGPAPGVALAAPTRAAAARPVKAHRMDGLKPPVDHGGNTVGALDFTAGR